MLQFSCPNCSKPIKADEDQAGENIICPRCGQTVTVPSQSNDQEAEGKEEDFSIFDDDDQFIEEGIAGNTQAKYRTPEDEREAVIDDDEQAAAEEEAEQKEAVFNALLEARNAGVHTTGASSDMTVDEKIKAEKKFQAYLDSLPDDSPLKQKGWIRPESTEETLALDNRPGNAIGARCPVCESISFVHPEKAGTTIVCDDCGSQVPVPVPAAEDGSQDNQPEIDPKEIERQRKAAKIADELLIEPPEDDEGYGLAPAPEDLLKPVVPILPVDEDAESDAVDILAPEAPAERPRKSLEETVTSELFEEMQGEKEVRFERLPLAWHLLSLLLDIGFLLRAILLVIVTMTSFSIYYFAQMIPIELAVKFFQIWAFPFIPIVYLMTCALGQKVMNSTIVGEKKMPDIEPVSPAQFVADAMFVFIGFSIGAFPGLLIGLLIFSALSEVNGFWAIPAMASLTGMLISPFLILTTLHAGSPFKFHSKRISESIRSNSDSWIEFYMVTGVISIAVCSLWFLGTINNWFVVLVMSVLVNLGFGLYFRALGRLMGIIVNSPRKKNKTATEPAN